MNFKLKSKFLSILLSALMLISALTVGEFSVYAAESAVSVTVASVKHKYSETKTILDLCNSYRTASELPNLVMDSTLMEKAMHRAVELSLFASGTSPDGSSGIQNVSQLMGYDVKSNTTLVSSWKNTSSSSAILLSSDYKSAGVGVVTVNGYKYVSVLLSKDTANAVNSSVYSQEDLTSNEAVDILPSNLTGLRVAFSNGQKIACGSSIQAYLRVTNKGYTSASAYLTPDNMKVSIENTESFVYVYDRIYAIAPGESNITITSTKDSSITASGTLKAVGLTFDSCTFSSIPDQYYTGRAITPSVSVKIESGVALTLGTDYTLEYQNNVNIGTATVVVTGKGSYLGQSKNINFNIVVNSSSSFSIFAMSSLSNLSLGQSTTISVSQSGGIEPVTYSYSYAQYGTSNWKSLSSSTSTCTFKPAEAKNYNLKVTATDNSGRTASQTLVIRVSDALSCSLSLSQTTLSLGGKVVINGTATGGVAPYTYAIYVKAPSSDSWKTLSDFSSTATYTYVSTEPGEHNVCFKCKSNSGQEAKVYKSFTVTGTVLSNNSSVSSSSLSFGGSTTLKGSASGGSGSYTYGYYYKLSSSNSWSTLQDFSSASSVTFTPKNVGTYNICIKVKDSTGNIAKKYIDITVSSSLANSSTLSASTINLGKTVTVNAVGKNGTGSYTYGVWYRRTGTTSWTTAQSYGTNSKVTITPAAATSYEIVAKVKDSSGYVVSKTLTLNVNKKLANNSKLSSASVETGKNLTVKCAASGGSGSYTYLIQYRKSGDSQWTVKQNYSSNASAVLTFSSAGTYEIYIAVKDGLSDVVSVTKTLTVKNTLTMSAKLSSSSVIKGKPATVTISASGGTGSYTYAVLYRRTGTESWSTVQNYASASSVKVTPLTATDYEICAKVKDSSGTIAKTYLTLTAKPSVSVTAKLSAASVIKGKPVTVTATGKDGTGSYTYAVLYRRTGTESWSTVQNYASTPSVKITPLAATNYDICVKAKDSGGDIAKTYLTLTATPSVSVTAKLSATSVIKGKPVTVTATGKDGTGSYTYAVLYRRTGTEKWTTVQNYASTSSVKITPLTATNYDICVKAKDSGGDTAKTYLTLTATPSVSVTAKLSAASVIKGKPVTVTATGKDGTGSYTYAVLYRRTGTEKWTTVQNYASTSSVEITPLAATDYDICVKAKDSGGDTAKTYLTLKATPTVSVTAKLSASSIVKGKSVTVTATGKDGTGSYTYAVLYRRKGTESWTTVQNYASSSSVTITPLTATDYDICVKAKDSGGDIAKTYLSLTVTQ